MASKDTPQETPDGREAKGRGGGRVLLCPVPPPPPPPPALSQHTSLPSSPPPPPPRSRCWNNPEVPELGEFFDRGGGGEVGEHQCLETLQGYQESVSKVLGGGGEEEGGVGFLSL